MDNVREMNDPSPTSGFNSDIYKIWVKRAADYIKNNIIYDKPIYISVWLDGGVRYYKKSIPNNPVGDNITYDNPFAVHSRTYDISNY